MTLSNTRQHAAYLAELGISPELIAARGFSAHFEPKTLVLVEKDNNNRELFLTSEATVAWRQLKSAAARDGESLFLVSAFRSIERQAEIIRQKLNKGILLHEILAVNAPPGFSEHHTGRAIDVSSPGVPVLELVFEQTSAFAWLTQHAENFGFYLSFPRHNAQGFQYEPWHWCFEMSAVGGVLIKK